MVIDGEASAFAAAAEGAAAEGAAAEGDDAADAGALDGVAGVVVVAQAERTTEMTRMIANRGAIFLQIPFDIFFSSKNDFIRGVG